MRALLLLVVLSLLPGGALAQGASYDPPTDPPEPEVVRTGGIVSAIAVAEDGTVVAAEIGGPVWRLDPGADEPRVVFEPDVTTAPEWGVFGLALAPDFAQTGGFFLSYTTAPPGTDVEAESAQGTVKVVRVRDGEEAVLYEYGATRSHNGGKLLLLGGLLYVTNGDHDRAENAQDPASEDGKILRMTLDGQPAPGNPHETSASWHPYAFSMGHRNPYGFAHDATRGVLVASENGEYSKDEVNVVEKGANYGWPACEGRCETPSPAFTEPILEYPRIVSPVGMASVGGDHYLGTFNYNEVRRLFETPDGWADEVVYVHDQGVLDLVASPDGAWLYFGSWNGLYRIPRPAHAAEPTAPTTTPATPPTDEAGLSPATPGGSASAPTGGGLPLQGDELEDARAAEVPGPGALLVVAAAGILARARRRRRGPHAYPCPPR